MIDALLARYAKCASYRDEGTSIWRLRDAETTIETHLRFTTAFVRTPLRFRFFVEETVGDSFAKSVLIHANESDVRVVSSNRPLQRSRTLRDAIKPDLAATHGVLMIAVPLLLGWPETMFPRYAQSLEFSVDDTELVVSLDARGAIASVREEWQGHAINGGPTAMQRHTRFRAELGVPIADRELRLEATSAPKKRTLN